MPAREEADRLPAPLPSAGRFSMVVTTWFGGAGGGGCCSWGCGGSGGIIAAEAAVGGYQNAARYIVRGLWAREHAEDPAEQPRPGRRCRLRSNEAGRLPRLRTPPPRAVLWACYPVLAAHPRSGPPPPPARALPLAATQVLAHPAKWLQRGSAGPGPAGSTARTVQREDRAGFLFLSLYLGLVLAKAVAVAPLLLVPGSLRKLRSVSHRVREQE